MIHAEFKVSSGRPIVTVTRDEGCNAGAWARVLEALNRGIVGGSLNHANVRADVFMAEVGVFREIRDLFGERLEFGAVLTGQIRQLASDRRAREEALKVKDDIDLDSLGFQLEQAGFRRKLKRFQLANLAVLQQLPHGADFSVPGAGKTTVALANFALQRQRGIVQRMLVIGPIAAFEAWTTDAAACFLEPPKITVHSGADCIVPDNTEILLTNYNRVANDYDRIRKYVAELPSMVVLDEAHRIKRGADGVHGRAVLDLAYAARRRDVLTGTPAPQGAYDLIALMRFLYPGQDSQILPQAAYSMRDARDPEVLAATSSAITRYFVRTTKSSLGLPKTDFEVIQKPMGPIQQAIYDALLGRYRGVLSLDKNSRRTLDKVGKVVMYLLEAATNPMLLVAGSDDEDIPEFRHPPLAVREGDRLIDLLTDYHLHENPWKYQAVRELAHSVSMQGEKLLVWSSFVRNLKILKQELREFYPAVVHGGIPSRSTGNSTGVTREDELDRFRNDPSCSVLLANPAACGEGISLHHWCHQAVYLDCTFNAGQFLQSQDRIHRLGLPDTTVTKFTLLRSQGSIDQTVGVRLKEKVSALSMLMDDPGLVRAALPEPDEGNVGPPIFDDDLQAVLAHMAD